jgi:hypothetical protein
MRLYRLEEDYDNISEIELELDLNQFLGNSVTKSSLKSICEILNYFLGKNTKVENLS